MLAAFVTFCNFENAVDCLVLRGSPSRLKGDLKRLSSCKG